MPERRRYLVSGNYGLTSLRASLLCADRNGCWRSGMMTLAPGGDVILGRERLQEARGLAQGPCIGSQCSSCRRKDTGLSPRVTTQSDDARRSFGPDEYRGGSRPKESQRIRSLHKHRTQLDLGARVSLAGRPRLRGNQLQRLCFALKPDNRSSENATRPAKARAVPANATEASPGVVT